MASRSINKVVLLGNLTRDPELKYTPAGTAVCTFGVATNRSWTTADGQIKEEAQYHRIVAWQKLAELCGKLLSKGRKIYLEGRITYREYTDKNGQERHITEIVLDDFIVFSDGKRYDRDAVSRSTSTDTKVSAEKTEESKSDDKDQDQSAKEDKEDEEKKANEDKTEKKEENEDVNPDDIPF
ncbi:hypothetical protein A3A93_06235 [Candidatus Roizmanbacteria bacterium RIFCSPLOWO2_01_FULL_38_12]|uniref:Single-stranded DNA-binding protein n=1 Tax=Candidatus Roizmanbacteria bacterium RIFCSPLOWO2_01_FULL_38_12 TaxID=1802061 RepID=A0A1F7ITY5_9BACT|nr:MAG: hypothetical protein A2861_02005 [Candidatus Roizmanbacteria bacterium RIFCSPHIGHO2_01_FULL_38_15]OGK34843.1 MAG: hypothetical protein A3F59_00550 [Candidatus Roizmanbacteria bacterium RIFCSPHIGHO2_12_FULL_38_13]OGK46828.1 MAG: hypothetical protein A3A93_06235 [Candidatus Roizmanbacteria bacterium RIFCSPLOWO2_01_FULL_38_12]